MRNTRQSGFSLLELLVAMTILAVIGTIGFVQFKEHTAQARYLKAKDNVQTVGKGLDNYYIDQKNHGVFPELASWEAMIEPNSPLVKGNYIPANVPARDPWGQPFEGTSTKGNYTLKCVGDPSNSEEFGSYTQEPGRYSDSSQPSTPTVGATPTPEAPK